MGISDMLKKLIPFHIHIYLFQKFMCVNYSLNKQLNNEEMHFLLNWISFYTRVNFKF